MTYLHAIIAGLIAGPVYAWAMTLDTPRRRFEARMQRFRNGEGKDPAKAHLGPHKPLWENAVAAGLIVMLVGGIIANMAQV